MWRVLIILSLPIMLLAQEQGWSCELPQIPETYSLCRADMEKLMWVRVSNKEKKPTDVYLHLEVKKEKEGLVARANTNRVTIPPKGKLITRWDIANLTDVWYKPEMEKHLLQGVMPAGVYRICVYIYKWKTKTLLAKDCITRRVTAPGPPRLIFPQNESEIESKNPNFQWTPPSSLPPEAKVRYSLRIYELLPEQSPADAAKGFPIYKKDGIKTSFHIYPVGAKAFEKDKDYWWQVEAVTETGIPLGKSALWKFHPRRAMATLPDFDFIPPAPFVWGCPASSRSRSEVETPEATPPEEGEEPGTTEPLGLVWGGEAARLYLIEPLWRDCQITWDHSSIEGCDSVLLQISGPDGFQIPNAENAMDDEGVVTSYIGPPRTTCPLGIPTYDYELRRVGDSEYSISPSHIDLQYTETLHVVWLSLQVRLVPLDRDLNQIDIASDPVNIYCVDPPWIEIESYDVRWIWGETPRRVIDFTLRCGGRFPPILMGSVSGPATLIIGTRPYRELPDGWARRSFPGTLTEGESEITRQNTFYDDTYVDDRTPPFFIMEIDEWVPDTTYNFSLEQEWPFARYYETFSLDYFTHPRLVVFCIPGIRPSWHYCGGSIYDREDAWLPDIDYDLSPCEYDFPIQLSAEFDYDGFDQIYDFITSGFEGRRVSSIDGEQEVEIEFEFPEVTNAYELLLYLWRHPGGSMDATMRETISGETRTYRVTFWGGQTVELWAEFGDRLEYTDREMRNAPGRMVLGLPDNLEMRFGVYHPLDEPIGDPPSWSMWEDVDYYLTRRE